jgi:hypothetical protein
MVDAHSVDLFFVRNLAEWLPAWDRQPGRKVGNRRHDFGGIAGTEHEVFHALMDEESLEGADFAGVQTCERQDSQAQSIAFKISRRRTPDSIEGVFSKLANGGIT